MDTATPTNNMANSGGNQVGGYGNQIGQSTPAFGGGTFGIYPVDAAQLAAIKTLSYQFENLWTNIVHSVPAGNLILLTNIKTKLDEAYMFAARGITKPAVNNSGIGLMSF